MGGPSITPRLNEAGGPRTPLAPLAEIFEYEDFDKLSLGQALAGLRTAAKLNVLATKGLVRDSQDNRTELEDLRLIHCLADLVDSYATTVANEIAGRPGPKAVA